MKYTGISQEQADRLRGGHMDAYGNLPEIVISEGADNPCRCCLRPVPQGAKMLVLAWRPFAGAHPYAETGPVFICGESCQAHCHGFPEVLGLSREYLVKGYNRAERIIYGTGEIVASEKLEDYAQRLLQRPDVAFVDIRSARNTCWQARCLPDEALSLFQPSP